MTLDSQGILSLSGVVHGSGPHVGGLGLGDILCRVL